MANKSSSKDKTAKKAGHQSPPPETTDNTDKKECEVVAATRRKIRNLNKRIKKIEETEVAKASGAVLNKDQVDLLASKQKTLGAIEELTKFLPFLEEAVSVDIAAAEQRAKEEQAAEAASSEDQKIEAIPVTETPEVSLSEPNGEEVSSTLDTEKVSGGNSASLSPEALDAVRDAVHRVVYIVYFCALFNNGPGSDLVNQAERRACLSYDEVTDENPGRPLTVEDLDNIHEFGRHLMMRQPGKTVCHKGYQQPPVLRAYFSAVVYPEGFWQPRVLGLCSLQWCTLRDSGIPLFSGFVHCQWCTLRDSRSPLFLGFLHCSGVP
eukprot:jgi/Botrbrau1/22456/Bobra.0091s0058.1